jgi:acyl-CoA reductase-like NAD-dependent aldehyde dehydrogenase
MHCEDSVSQWWFTSQSRDMNPVQELLPHLNSQHGRLYGCCGSPTHTQSRHSCVVQEEVFGPVATILPRQNYEELIAQANGTKYGLSACIVTQNLHNALETARRLKAGYVQVNSGLVIQPGVSFGGYKSSGIRRESSLESMLEAYTQVKKILIDHSN